MLSKGSAWLVKGGQIRLGSKRSIRQISQVSWLEGAQTGECSSQRKQQVVGTRPISGNEGDSGWLGHKESWKVVLDMK